MSLNGFTLAVCALAIQFPLTVTSWIRSSSGNAAVGGVADSFHLCGLAVDLRLDDPLVTNALKARASKLGLRALDEGDHIHLQPL